MASSSVIQTARAYRGMELFFALKPEGSDKWTISNKRFVLNIGEHMFGEYLTTMWFNNLIRIDVAYEFMIIKVAVESDFRQRNQIANQINSGSNYRNIPNVFLYGRISTETLRETKNKIEHIMDGEMYAMASIPVRCELVIGDKNSDEIIITVQGSYKKNTLDTSCDEPEIMYTFTLPMFRTTI